MSGSPLCSLQLTTNGAHALLDLLEVAEMRGGAKDVPQGPQLGLHRSLHVPLFRLRNLGSIFWGQITLLELEYGATSCLGSIFWGQITLLELEYTW